MYNVFGFLFLFIFSCQPSAGTIGGQSIEPLEELQSLGYTKFTVYKLPGYLKEISGLSYLNEHTLLCHNDEEGEFYHFNLKTGEVDKKTRFGSDDDYEGITHDEDHVYIVRSSGHISKFSTKTKKTKVINTPLNTSNNVEGLELVNGKLVLACKGDSGKSLGKHTRALYSFDLETNTLDETPMFLIDEKELESTFDKNKEKFRPSGIAMHPNGEEFYITSAFESKLLITNNSGELKTYLDLDKKVLPQTEGIAFGPKGQLYLASEGKGERGRILVCE